MRIGPTSRDNDKTHAALSGNSFSFDSAGNDNELGGYLSLTTALPLKTIWILLLIWSLESLMMKPISRGSCR